MFAIKLKKCCTLLQKGCDIFTHERSFTNPFYKISLVLLLLFFGLTGSATIYYVSSSGNDSNSGTSESQAWKSLEKVSSSNFRAGDQILFKKGEEWTGTIKVTSSGVAGSPIVYGAYGTGANPKIYGSEAITGWTHHSGNIYKAPLNTTIEQLFINGKRALMARYPNSGYFKITSVLSSTKFSSSNLNSGINYTGASWIGRTTAFTMFSKKITASSAQTLTIESAPFDGGLGAGEGFFLADKLEFLDSPGEWYYDASTNTVYFWTPTGNTPANDIVRGASFSYGIDISNVNYITVQDFEILHSTINGIYIYNSDFITVDNNRIISPDMVGIHIPSANSTAAKITNNYIYQANAGGIRCYSPSANISGNKVEDTGLLKNINKSTYPASDNFGTGIFSRADNPTISYNRVINSGYNGINWKGQNGNISYNYVNGACLVLDDGGGIYTYNGSNYSATGSKGSEVLFNIVLNVHGTTDGFTSSSTVGYGIYMDNNTHDVNIKYNTVGYTSCGIFLHEAGIIDISDNIIMDALLGIRISGVKDVNTIQGNTLYLTSRTGTFVWWKNSHQRMIFNMEPSVSCNNNTYINHYESAPFSCGGSDRKFPEWKSLTSKDKYSTFDGLPMTDGEKEQLFYNDTKQSKKINLGTSVYKDLNGNSVSGSITLEPFTSKILIKTGSEGSSINQGPAIENQAFQIQGDLQLNQFVGQVTASDPDAEQTLNFSITQGNDGNIFYIEPTTGEIYANTTIQSTNYVFKLVVTVTDNATSPLSASANVDINIVADGITPTPDITAPSISSFSIPSTSTTLNIPISSFTATDDNAVAGYLLTETASKPSAGTTGWTSSAPANYTFSQAGTKTIYAWVKDAAGNISNAIQRNITISIPDLSSTYSEYLFEEASGQTAFDSQGSNDGTIFNETSRIQGVNGSGLKFNGSGYINFGECFGENVQDELTLSAWIKPDANSTGYQGIIMHGGPIR